MKIIQARQADIMSCLQAVNGVIERRSSLAILGFFLLRKAGPSITFTASDLETQSTSSAVLSMAPGDHSLAIEARKFVDILKSLPQSAEVDVAIKGEKVTVKSGRSRFTLNSLSAADFPLLVPETHHRAIKLPQSKLLEMLSSVSYAMAVDDVRFYLRATLVEIRGGQLNIVATDGHRLSCGTHAMDGVANDISVLVPRKVALELIKQVKNVDDPVTIHLGDRQVRFEFGAVEIVSKLIEARFPDYLRVIPNDNAHQLKIEREVLLSGLRRAAVMVGDDTPGVRLTLARELLTLQSSNANHTEEALVELDAQYQGPSIEMGFNIAYLIDAVSATSDDSLTLAFGGNGNPLLITTEGGFKHVVMPMRI